MTLQKAGRPAGKTGQAQVIRICLAVTASSVVSNQSSVKLLSLPEKVR